MASLSSALFSSVSGLDTTSTAISVIGDNIANVNTPGFKERRVEFSDVLGQTISNVVGFSNFGAGAKVSRTTTLFTQGTFENTGRPTDLAIEGRGFFVLGGQQGNVYTRAGIFTIDSEGFVVNPDGLRLQGSPLDPVTGLSTGQFQDITVSAAQAPPRATTEIDLSVNLDSGAALIPGGFDPADIENTSEYRSLITAYDSLGNGHPVSVFFTKTAANTWEWNATLPQGETTLAPVPGATDVVQGSGTLTFDTSGTLTAATGSPVTFEFGGGGAAGQAIVLDFGPIAGVGTGDGTTQFARDNTTNSFVQDGFAAGALQAISIDREGFLTGQFDNGEVLPLARIALASFPNVEGLLPIGGNNLIETRTSGQPLLGDPESGSFGSIRSSNLEQSTVDLAAQFVRLIINQRAFQANTRTISATNELLANLVSLGQ
jgi:flagellar hook protein FlgE